MQDSVHRLLLFVCSVIVAAIPLSSQAQSVVLSGYVEDEATGERLVGATVYDARHERGTATNQYGFFSLSLPADTVHLDVSYVGYRDTTLVLALDRDTSRPIRLRARALGLDEVEVTAEPVMEAGISRTELTPQQIRELPVLLGETDVLKAIQLMPGVQGGMEGSAGIHVRGGSPDQNLILLDGAPVYNVSHLFGFFSVFNNDAIRNVQLVKGGFPARYGGRLSSVVDVTMREGNLKEFAGTGSIGLLASRLTVEGPIARDRSSFIISGRRTYLDLVTRPFYHFARPDASVGYYFHDLNAKANYIVSNRTRAFLSFYGGGDRFYSRESETFRESGITEAQDVGLEWGNLTATARLTHVFSPMLFASAMLLHSRYRFGASFEQRLERPEGDSLRVEESRVGYRSGLRDWGARIDLDYAPAPGHAIETGVSLTHHTFRPDVHERHYAATGVAPFDASYADPLAAVEWAAYAEDRLRIRPALTARLGLHASGFRVDGRWYGSLQPRLSAGYRLSGGWRARAAFTTMRQYIHLLTNSAVGLPTDLWVPATGQVGPQDAWQVGLGLEHTLAGRRYEVSLDGFYKAMDGVIAYEDGASFVETGSSWEDKVTSGNGQSYGVELFARKRLGRTTGWVGYTLSWAWRQFEEIGRGERFPYRYDRRHDLSLVLSHDLSERRSFSVAWVYKTGHAATLPVARYSLDAAGFRWGTFDYYGRRNGIRMRPHHRLDLAYRILYPTSWGRSELSFGLYNAYSRMNPFYMTLEQESEYDPRAERRRTRYFYKEVSLIPVVPFVNYRFEF